jgi:hypothetical protein
VSFWKENNAWEFPNVLILVPREQESHDNNYFFSIHRRQCDIR